MNENNPIRVLSFGAGTQSSCLLAMSCLGELEKLDCAIFSDTGWEPPEVYEYLELMRNFAAQHGIPVVTVSAGNIRSDMMNAKGKKRVANMPLFTVGRDGKAGPLLRQCTSEYKIAPIKKHIRALLGIPKGGRVPRGKVLVEQWFGMSLDEPQRLKDSDVKWIKNRHPLFFEKRMRRDDSIRWMEQHGFPTPPRSACIGCPYRTNMEWRRMKDERPELWKDAVEFDNTIRTGLPGVKSQAFLHRQLVPLQDVDLSTDAEHGIQDMFMQDECSGMCGV